MPQAYDKAGSGDSMESQNPRALPGKTTVWVRPPRFPDRATIQVMKVQNQRGVTGLLRKFRPGQDGGLT